jgi:hypothetical protein
MCRRLRAALLALGIVLSASSVRAQVVYSGRVYTARGHSWHQLRVIQVSDGKTTALTDSARSHHWPRCTLDGRYIYFLSNTEDDEEIFPQQIWRFERSTGTESLVFRQPNLPPPTDADYSKREIWGLIGPSADGRAIFFDIGAGEVLKFDGTETRLATTKEGTFSVLSPEARRIALIGQDGHLRVINTSGRLLKDSVNAIYPRGQPMGNSWPASPATNRSAPLISRAGQRPTRLLCLRKEPTGVFLPPSRGGRTASHCWSAAMVPIAVQLRDTMTTGCSISKNIPGSTSTAEIRHSGRRTVHRSFTRPLATWVSSRARDRNYRARHIKCG